MFPYGRGFLWASLLAEDKILLLAIHIIVTQTRDRIQILGLLPALGKGKESLSEQLAGTDTKMHRY